uniref:UPAR/Ly6 domain-containing protein n=2 Tax=Loxodonta africana TaxID=9785 RepID=G3U7S0_LOXAF
MGKHFLLLLLGFSMSIGFLQALFCYRCDLLNAFGVCLSGRGYCVASQQEDCILKEYYQAGRLVFGYQNCRYICNNMTFFRGTFQMDVKCCRHHDFCNRF